MDDSEHPAVHLAQIQREVLLRHSLRCRRWDQVIFNVRRGVSAGSLEDALQEAVQDEQWDCVAHIIRQCQWDHIPQLVMSCDRPEVTDIALRHAVTYCHWSCVGQLVSVGVLTKEQGEYVCNEALPQGHFECTVELLGQGVSPGYIRWMVHEDFRSGKWQLIVDLCKRGLDVSREVRKHAVSAAIEFTNWDAYMGILQVQLPSDQDLSAAMLAAVIRANTLDHDFLLKVIRGTKSGLRVFKQLCLKVSWPNSTSSALYLNVYTLEKDLAFYVAVTQGLWAYVLQQYEDESISRKSRQFALRHAIRQRAWQHAVQMASKSPTGQAERRMAFLKSVRQGELRTALELLNQGLNLNSKDARFALKTCCCLGQLHGMAMLSGQFDLDPVVILKSLINKAVTSDDADFIVKLLHQDDCCFKLLYCFDIAGFATERVMKLRKWTLLKEIVDDCLTCEHFRSILEKIFTKRKAWQICVPAFEKWCTDLDGCDFDELIYESENVPGMLALTKWCCKTPFPNMAVCLALISKNWELVNEALVACAESVCKDLLITGISVTAAHNNLDTTAALMQYVDPMDDDLDDLRDSDFYDLRDKCRERGLASWVIHLSIKIDEWDVVETEIETCRDQSLIDYTISEAASVGQWTVVERLLDRCSQNDGFLGDIFLSSVTNGNLACARRLITRVNLPAVPGFRRVLYEAAYSEDNREDMVRLCIGAGISTHQKPAGDFMSPMWVALYHGHLPIVRLLHESGCCSSSELYRLKNDMGVRALLEHHQDIVQYVEHAASNPASLQPLCRLTVSHLVGCRPGHRDRVASLPVPGFVQDYIMFSDLTS